MHDLCALHCSPTPVVSNSGHRPTLTFKAAALLSQRSAVALEVTPMVVCSYHPWPYRPMTTYPMVVLSHRCQSYGRTVLRQRSYAFSPKDESSHDNRSYRFTAITRQRFRTSWGRAFARMCWRMTDCVAAAFGVSPSTVVELHISM